MISALHNLVKSQSKRKIKRVGRGDSSGHGTYAGRGLKGQRSRSGGKNGLFKLGLQPTLRGIPKKRGFKSLYPKKAVVNLDELDKNFKEGEKVTFDILLEKKIATYSPMGLKILGSGKLTKKLQVTASAFSKKAKEAIVKAGGEAREVK
ncbi:MAG: 50S ribosomal protein L15 [Patescibacteria group bacterium]